MSDADHDPLEEEAFSASLAAVDAPLLRFRLLPPAAAAAVPFLDGLQSRMSMIGEGGLKSCPRRKFSLSLPPETRSSCYAKQNEIIFGASSIITSITTG